MRYHKPIPPRRLPAAKERGITPEMAVTEEQVRHIKLQWRRLYRLGTDYMALGEKHLLESGVLIHHPETDKAEELSELEAATYLGMLKPLPALPREKPARKFSEFKEMFKDY